MDLLLILVSLLPLPTLALFLLLFLARIEILSKVLEVLKAEQLFEIVRLLSSMAMQSSHYQRLLL